MVEEFMSKAVYKRNLAVAILCSFLLATLIISPLAYYVLSNPDGSTVVFEHPASEASYIVWEDGGTYYAKNGKTGAIDYSGTDASTVIQQAIDASTSGEWILIKAGIYDLTSGLILNKENITIQGLGYSTILSPTSTQTAIVVKDSAYITIKDLQIEGKISETVSPASKDGNGILIYETTASTHNITIEHVKIVNVPNAGIMMSCIDYQNPVEHINIRSCYINNVKHEGIAFLYGSGTSIIKGNTIITTGFHGIVLSMGGDDCIIEGNYIRDIGSSIGWEPGYYAHGIALDRGADRNVIANNIVRDTRMNGIEIADNSVENLVIGNIVRNATEDGIYVGGGLNPGHRNQIVGNSVMYCHQSGIEVGGTNETAVSRDNQVVGNLLYNNGLDDEESAIKLIDVRNTLVSGNSILYNGQHGIYVLRSSNTAIDGNTIVANDRGNLGYDGIHGTNSTYVTVTGNAIYDDQGSPTQDYAIETDGTCDHWLIDGNRLYPNQLGTTNLVGTNNVIGDNLTS